MASPDPGSISLGSLSIEQLQQLRQAGQQELEFLNQSVAQLQNAVDRLQSSRSCAMEYSNLQQDNPLMVPLTSSIYVEGVVKNDQKLLVDLGTGYFAERTPEQAAEYFKRRVVTVKEQIEKASSALSQKRQHVEAVTIVLQRKVALSAQQS
uniref:Prefoldin subunit 5 n=1 Tax=Timspurckia oligopyrenoides TaxID=708627 RepID=A0A7S1EUP1_9RHOD|mmetsp:Transcript_872/g.1627  ORF Transcript_872/g.1627 Transcript_872/m.1627 type:complete len:151 (+) Transcript_872:114-566(+)